jgi:NAD(P)-dependent dehydrogenase (short-subunit alcohol dehydrogenase family)
MTDTLQRIEVGKYRYFLRTDNFENMSNNTASRLAFMRDLILSMITLACGRLYPTLKPPPADLTGKVAVITGANSGIGLQIALEMARQGATVYLACRNPSKAVEAASQVTTRVPASIDRVKTLSLDTSSLSSVREFVETWKYFNTEIDLLFHNAGISGPPNGQTFTTEGFPTIYATNFLGSFLLTYLLEPYLSEDARVTLTSSTGQYSGAFSTTFSLGSTKERLEPGFHVPVAAVKAGAHANDSVAYGNSKAMQAAFARLLQDHFDRKANEAGKQNRRVAHAFSPGFTHTPIFAKTTVKTIWDDPLFWILTVTTFLATDVSQGAATGVWLASTQDRDVVGRGMGGGYWDRMTRRLSSVDMMSKEKLERLWVRWEADAGVEWR